MTWTDRIGRRLKLNDLHILMIVAESGSMGKAAKTLGISQPSVSKAISDIEHTIGVRLLDRSADGAALTVYGQALVMRGIIPSPIDQNRWAHWRNPMDMIRQG
jgi:molybdate transport repressor ModE-like protein